MNLQNIFFWENLSFNAKSRLIYGLVLLICCIALFIWFSLYAQTQQTKEEISRVSSRYEEVLPLAQKIVQLQNQQTNVSEMAPMPAAQNVVKQLQLRDHMASISPIQLGPGQEAVQMYFESLNLPQIVDLMHNLEKQAGFRVMNFQFNHRMEDNDLADIKVVISR